MHKFSHYKLETLEKVLSDEVKQEDTGIHNWDTSFKTSQRDRRFSWSSNREMSSGRLESIVLERCWISLKKKKKVEWKNLEKEHFFLSVFQSFGLTMGHVGSQFPYQRLNPIPCIGRQSLHHWTTSKAPEKEHLYELLKRRFREGQAARSEKDKRYKMNT